MSISSNYQLENNIVFKDAPIGLYKPIYNKLGTSIIYLDNRLKEIDSNAYGFLRLQGLCCAEVTQKEANCYIEENRKELLRVAISVGVFVVSSLCSINIVSAAGFSLCPWLLSGQLKCCAANRIKEEKADNKATQKANKTQLEGGIRFYMALQQILQRKVNDNLLNLLFFTPSGEKRFILLEELPSLEGRVSKLKSKLKDLGEQWECTETDQETIKKIEKLFYSDR